MSDLDADVVALTFLPGTSCLLASDSDGEITLWVIEQSGSGTNTTGGTQGALMARKTQYSIRDGVEAWDRRESAPAWDARGVTPTVNTSTVGDTREPGGREGDKDDHGSGTSHEGGSGGQESCTLERALQQTRVKEVRSHE